MFKTRGGGQRPFKQCLKKLHNWHVMASLMDSIPWVRCASGNVLIQTDAQLISFKNHHRHYHNNHNPCQLNPGDTVWWHPDLFHHLEEWNTSSAFNSVLYFSG